MEKRKSQCHFLYNVQNIILHTKFNEKKNTSQTQKKNKTQNFIKGRTIVEQ
jgi:hypothetical protein